MKLQSHQTVFYGNKVPEILQNALKNPQPTKDDKIQQLSFWIVQSDLQEAAPRILSAVRQRRRPKKRS